MADLYKYAILHFGDELTEPEAMKVVGAVQTLADTRDDWPWFAVLPSVEPKRGEDLYQQLADLVGVPYYEHETASVYNVVQRAVTRLQHEANEYVIETYVDERDQAVQDRKEALKDHEGTKRMCDDLCDALDDAYKLIDVHAPDPDAFHTKHVDAIEKARGGSRFFDSPLPDADGVVLTAGDRRLWMEKGVPPDQENGIYEVTGVSEETDAADAQQSPDTTRGEYGSSDTPGSDSTVPDLLRMAERAHEFDRGVLILLVSFLGDALMERHGA